MTDQLEQLAGDLGQALRRRGWSVTCAESCTGGGIAAAITGVAGSSAWFNAGLVTYSNAAKTKLLGVDAYVLSTQGAVSEPVVRAMATGALRVAGADLAVAVSGIAGPDGGTAAKPVGTVWLAWASRNGVSTACHCFPGDRAAVRAHTVQAALAGLLALANAR